MLSVIKKLGYEEKAKPLLKKYFSNVNPNVITIFSVIMSIIGAYIIYAGNVFEALFFFVFAFAFDMFDGMLARALSKTSQFGAYLDGIADRITEFFALAPMLYLQWQNQTIAIASIVTTLFFGTCMTSFARAYADHKKALKHEDIKNVESFFERSERVLLILVALALYTFNPTYSMYVLVLAALVSIHSFIERFLCVYRYSGGKVV